MAASYPPKGDALAVPQLQPSVAVAAAESGATGERNKKWQMEMMMEKLRSKTGQYKSFLETTKALKMSLMDKRYPMDGIERQQLQKCLDGLQHSFKVTSLQAMVERLESVTRQLGLKFMAGLSGTDWFISSDMFYLEVVLEPNGGVKDVKIHHEGKVEQQSCEELVSCLSRGDFGDFTKQLEGLAAIYQLNADKKLKSKAFLALQALETDLSTLAGVQAFIKEPHNLVHKSPVGVLEKRKGGHPMRLTYFVSPYDLLDEKTRTSVPLTVETVTGRMLGQSVEVCIEGSNTSHKLPTLPLISVTPGPSGGKSTPVYAGVTPQNSAVLPASFVLRLRTPMPMCVALAKLIQQETEVECGDLSAPQPLLSLITRHCSAGALDCANNKGLFVTLPDQQHCYFLTEGRGLGAVLVQNIPFTHPAHVPKVLTLLRQQALFNTLVASCVRPSGRHEFENLIIFEVSALSWQQLSISFEHPLEESMATVELDLSDLSGVRCRLYSSASDTLNMTDFASKVVQRCLSIPITMRALIHKWQGQTLKAQHSNGNFNISLGNFSLGNLGDQSQGKVSDFDNKNSSKTSDQSNGAVSSHGQLGSVMSQLSHNYPSNLDSPNSRDSFFPSSQLSVEPLNAGQKTPPVLLSMLNEQQKSKKRKRKSAGDSSGIWAGRSPKRKMSSEEFGELNEDTQGSTESSTPLGTPTQVVDIDMPEERGTISPPETTMEPFEFEEESGTSDSINDIEEIRNMKKLKKARLESRKNSSASSDSKNFSDNHQAPPTILLAETNKSLVAPSVSITPISAATLPASSPGISNMLTGMGLERRPGIEIIPIGSSQGPALPSSITITPIKSEERSKERSREDKLKSRDSKKLDEKRLEKKRKRRREGSPSPDSKVNMRLEVMGPPQAPSKGTEKSSSKQDSMNKPVPVNVKTTSSPATSPPLSSSSVRKFSNSPTQSSSSSSSSKPMSLVKTSTSPTPKPPKTSQSPKHSSSGSSPIYGSPKHTASPKHSSLSPKQSSSGKPSMSALKSASSGSLSKSGSGNSSSGGDMTIKIKKDKKSSSSLGHNSPKSKSSSSSSSSSSTVKLKQPDFPLSGGDAPLPAQQQSSCGATQQGGASLKGTAGSSPPSVGGSTLAHGAAPSPNSSAQDLSTSPCSSTAATAPKCQVRNRKGSLSAVIDKLKSAQHYTEPLTKDQKDQTSSDKSKREGSSSSSSSQKTGDSKNVGSKNSEYQVKSSSDGIKITINKTQRNKESKMSSSKSSLPSSPKTSSHTGLKPGVISGPASKKPQQKPSSSKVSSPSSSSSQSSKIPSSSSSSKALSGLSPSASRPSKPSSSSPKSSGATDLRRDKPRPKTEKSIFSKERRLSPTPHRDRDESESERAFKLLAAHAKLDTGLPLDTPKLDTKFQIPKLSRNSENKDSDKKSVDRDRVLDLNKIENPKVELKRIDEKDKYISPEKNFKSSSSSSQSVQTSSPSTNLKISNSPSSVAKADPISTNKSSEVNESVSEKKSEKSNPSQPSKPKDVENTVLDLATKTTDVPSAPLPPTSPKSFITKHPEWFKEEDVKKPGPSGDLPTSSLGALKPPSENSAEVLLDFSSGERKSEVKLPKNTPPLPPVLPQVPIHLPPVLSPSVSVHIVKSPAPCSPLVLPSPHSSQPSPCITDDELMDEALVGLGK